MQGLERLFKLAEHCRTKYEESGTIVGLEVIPLGFGVRVVYKPNGRLFTMYRVISALEFEVLDLEGLKGRIDRMVRDIHLQYVQVINSEKSINADTPPN